MNYQQKAQASINYKQINVISNPDISHSLYSSIFRSNDQKSVISGKAVSLARQTKIIKKSTNSVKKSKSIKNCINLLELKQLITPKTNNTSMIQINSSPSNSIRNKKAIQKTYSNSCFPQELRLIKKNGIRNLNDSFISKSRKRNSFKQDIKLNFNNNNEDDIFDNMLSFPKELSNSIKLNKYKITSLSNIGQINTTIPVLNTKGISIHPQRYTLSQLENNKNKDILKCNKNDFPELEIITNNIISDVSDNNQSLLLANKFLSQYQIKSNNTNLTSTYIESYNQLVNPSNKMTNQITKSQTYNSNEETNTIMDNLSPIIKPKEYTIISLNQKVLPPSRNDPLTLELNCNDDYLYSKLLNENTNNKTKNDTFKIFQKKPQSMKIEKDKKCNTNRKFQKNIPQIINCFGETSNFQNPKAFNYNSNNKRNKRCTIPDSVKGIDLPSMHYDPFTLVDCNNEKVTLINFLSVPKIMNLIVIKEREILIPCIFVVTPNVLSYTHGIESYLIHYKPRNNNQEFQLIEACIDVVDILSCHINHFSPLRFTIQTFNKNTLIEYNIEAPFNELTMNYVKGINYLLFLQAKFNII